MTARSRSGSTASTAACARGISVADLALELGLEPAKVAVERNLEIVPRSTLAEVTVEDGDDLEIVHFVGAAADADGDDTWTRRRPDLHARG